MHYHCEIILPPQTEDVESAIKSILEPFNECDESNVNTFWDFYVIGGRFAGTKRLAKYDQDKIQEFHQWCREEKITVSSLQCGKQEIQPASQIPKVDAKWNEMFPSPDGIQWPCPIFKHSNDQYDRNGQGTLPDDICTLAECENLTCSRVIIAGYSYNGNTDDFTGPLEARFMVCEDVWNGVNHMSVAWDGTVKNALKLNAKLLKSYNPAYAQSATPSQNWLSVTVDYHS